MTRARWSARSAPLALEQVPDVQGALDHLGEEPLLGAEVAVDQRGGHPGVGGDLADPGALVALGGEAAGGRLEDGLAGRGGIPPPSRARTRLDAPACLGPFEFFLLFQVNRR